jgi:pimeloyl-ACP methyl ester carboxylesterase
MSTKKQSKPAMKRGKKIMLIFGIIAVVIAGFILVGAILHATLFTKKLQQIQPYGQLVNVDDGQMHVYSLGNGEKTIVLLPGMGVSLPSAEFGPLMRKLSQKYTVVCVEYFGVGFSSETAKPRTSENYVEETRAALNLAGFEAPYVLMPHSISTVFSEYYAAKYPQEVEALISLDGTSTALYGDMPAFVKSILPIAKFQQAAGLTSLLGPLATNRTDLLSKGYTGKEISDMLTFAGFTMNDTVLEQMINSAEFIKQTMELPYPVSIPYFKIISRQTYEAPNPQLKQFNLTPQEYQHKHLQRIGQQAKYEILDGTHFIYLNNVDRIAEITDAVLLKTNQ